MVRPGPGNMEVIVHEPVHSERSQTQFLISWFPYSQSYRALLSPKDTVHLL